MGGGGGGGTQDLFGNVQQDRPCMERCSIYDSLTTVVPIYFWAVVLSYVNTCSCLERFVFFWGGGGGGTENQPPKLISRRGSDPSPPSIHKYSATGQNISILVS